MQNSAEDQGGSKIEPRKFDSKDSTTVDPPLQNLPHVCFADNPSLFVSTLIELTKVDSKLEISFLEQSNPSKSLPKSRNTEPTTVDEDQEPSTKPLTPDQRKTLEYLNMTQISSQMSRKARDLFYPQAASS